MPRTGLFAAVVSERSHRVRGVRGVQLNAMAFGGLDTMLDPAKHNGFGG